MLNYQRVYIYIYNYICALPTKVISWGRFLPTIDNYFGDDLLFLLVTSIYGYYNLPPPVTRGFSFTTVTIVITIHKP